MQRRIPPRAIRGLLVLFLFLAAVSPLSAQQQPTSHTDILRGRVVSDSGMAVSGADVVATMAPDRRELATRTDSAGRFELRVLNGSGDYLLHVNGLGWKPWRQRVTRTGTDSILSVAVKLVAQAVALAPVTVRAERQKPSKRDMPVGGTGADEAAVAGVNGAVDPAQQGDLAAMAATLPGVNAVSGGVSVLGLAPSQNGATLNGMNFGGSDVPREARTWTHLATSTFDPARGGFSGAQTAVDLVPGNIFTFWRSHLTLDAPALQYTDPVAARLGQRYTNVQASLGSDGELVRDRYYFNVAAQGSRRLADATSLLDAGGDVLEPAGVAPDSVTRFLQLLSAAGVPLGSATASRVSTVGSVIGRLDHTPEAKRSWALTGYGKLARVDAPFAPTATATHGGSNSSAQGMLQAEHALYFGDNYLNLTKSALTLAADRTQPRLQLPDGRVLVGSDLGGGAGGFASLAFGGNAGLNVDNRAWSWETTDEVQWYNKNSRHKLKLFADSRLDGYDRMSGANRLGSYSYASLADFAANRPASYTRVLSAPDARGGEWSGVLAAGDQWRARPNLSLLFGARVEANRYTSAPALSPDVLSTFGARTDRAPNTVHVSPRLGFSWSVRKQPLNRFGFMVGPLGSRIISTTGVLRGGIGEFRQYLDPALLAGALTSTGLPGATQQLLCVGPAVPVPDWRALAGGAAEPAACADGSSAFVDTSPTVRLFDPGYDAARSWRANLGWASQLGKIAYSVDGILSLNLGQPGAVDLNFAGSPKFFLPDESGRPVYVSPSSVVSSTGAVSPLESRRFDAFGRVLSQRSDLRGLSRQLTASVWPTEGMGKYTLSLAYTLARSTTQFRGFDGLAFGDPGLRESAPGDYDIRHQFQVQAGYSLPWVNVTLFGVLASGRPFTPQVGGDINGDGIANDRAFVFDPAHAADPQLAAAMRSLLATSPGNVRACLERQLGQAAARNSCRAPWSADLRGQISLGKGFAGMGGLPNFGDRIHASLNFANPLSGLDQLLHGASHLHGWGTPALPDPVLYNVRGFDAAAQRFRYEVNPRFGDTRPSATTLRAPFRLTLDVSFDLGKPMDVQQMQRNLSPGRGGRGGQRLSAPALKQQYARNVFDVYQQILEQSDSLLLTPEQTQALKTAHAQYRTTMDSLWTDLATYLAAQPDHYDAQAVFKRQETAIDKGWEITWNERTTIKSILSPIQLRMVPQFVTMLINSEKVPKMRVYIRGG